MKELSFSEINEVSGAGTASAGLALTAGTLGLAAIYTSAAPPLSGFLALGAAIMGVAAAGAELAGY